MKKAFPILILVCIINIALGQTTKVGLLGGINFASLTASGTVGSNNSSNKIGYHVGFVVDIGLGDVSIQPGLLISTKGGSDSYSSVTYSYFEIPVNLLYNINLPTGGVFFVGGGPYMAYGFAGSDGVVYGSAPGNTTNPDFGFNFTTGLRFKTGFTISGNYGLGLTNLNNYPTELLNAKVTNRVLGISIGYFFK